MVCVLLLLYVAQKTKNLSTRSGTRSITKQDGLIRWWKEKKRTHFFDEIIASAPLQSTIDEAGKKHSISCVNKRTATARFDSGHIKRKTPYPYSFYSSSPPTCIIKFKCPKRRVQRKRIFNFFSLTFRTFFLVSERFPRWLPRVFFCFHSRKLLCTPYGSSYRSCGVSSNSNRNMLSDALRRKKQAYSMYLIHTLLNRKTVAWLSTFRLSCTARHLADVTFFGSFVIEN